VDYLTQHERVSAFIIPVGRTIPTDLAKRQMSGFGGMISLELRGGFPASRDLSPNCRCSCWREFGGVESWSAILLNDPCALSTSNAQSGGSRQTSQAVVGIEHRDDLKGDLSRPRLICGLERADCAWL